MAIGEIVVAAPRAFFLGLRCRGIQRRWLRRNSLQMISSEVRTFFQGPFFLATGDFDRVSRIEVKDASGRARRGFLCCRDHERGFLGRHHLDVRWDD